MQHQIKPDEFAKLKRNHLIVGFLYAFFGLFIFIGSFTIQAVKNFKPGLFTNYITYIRTGGTNYQPIYEITLPGEYIKGIPLIDVLKEVPFMLIVGIVLLLAALIHILIITKNTNAVYNNRLQAGTVKSRLYEGLIGSVMLPLLAIVIGVADVSTIALLFGLGLGYVFLTYSMEQNNKNQEKIEWSSYIAMVLLFVISAFSLGIAIYHQLNVQQTLLANATITVPYLKNFNYVLVAVYFGFWLLQLAQVFLQHKKVKWWKNPVFVENTQIIYGFVVKIAIVGMVFYGLINNLFTRFYVNL